MYASPGGFDGDFNGDVDIAGNFGVTGVSTFTGNIDVNGIIEGISGENKIPFLYSNLALPSASTYRKIWVSILRVKDILPLWWKLDRVS